MLRPAGPVTSASADSPACACVRGGVETRLPLFLWSGRLADTDRQTQTEDTAFLSEPIVHFLPLPGCRHMWPGRRKGEGFKRVAPRRCEPCMLLLDRPSCIASCTSTTTRPKTRLCQTWVQTRNLKTVLQNRASREARRSGFPYTYGGLTSHEWSARSSEIFAHVFLNQSAEPPSTRRRSRAGDLPARKLKADSN